MNVTYDADMIIIPNQYLLTSMQLQYLLILHTKGNTFRKSLRKKIPNYSPKRYKLIFKKISCGNMSLNFLASALHYLLVYIKIIYIQKFTRKYTRFLFLEISFASLFFKETCP